MCVEREIEIEIEREKRERDSDQVSADDSKVSRSTGSHVLPSRERKYVRGWLAM